MFLLCVTGMVTSCVFLLYDDVLCVSLVRYWYDDVLWFLLCVTGMMMSCVFLLCVTGMMMSCVFLLCVTGMVMSCVFLLCVTVDPRLSEPHLSEPSIIRTTKLMIFIAFVVCIK